MSSNLLTLLFTVFLGSYFSLNAMDDSYSYYNHDTGTNGAGAAVHNDEHYQAFYRCKDIECYKEKLAAGKDPRKAYGPRHPLLVELINFYSPPEWVKAKFLIEHGADVNA